MSDTELRKHIALQQANHHNHKSPSKSVEDNTNPRALTSIDETFTRLKAITAVGSAFKTATEENIVKQEWMLAFSEEGVTKQYMIDDGIEAVRIKARKSRSTTWFPSVGEFIDLCKGDDNKIEFAERSYALFIKRQKQVDNVGRKMLIENRFTLRGMNAEKGKIRFIELYLEFASKMPIESLDAFALTETVQLSEEQQKAKQDRTQSAQNEFMSKFNSFVTKGVDIPEEIKPKKYTEGVKSGSLGRKQKTQQELEQERDRQLKAMGLK